MEYRDRAGCVAGTLHRTRSEDRCCRGSRSGHEDFQDAISYITHHNLGNSVSDSWEEDTDIVAGPLEQKFFDQVLQRAAAKGISFQFSTGDGGDEGRGTGTETVGWGDTVTYISLAGCSIRRGSRFRWWRRWWREPGLRQTLVAEVASRYRASDAGHLRAG
jgi:hypothetical protein